MGRGARGLLLALVALALAYVTSRPAPEGSGRARSEHVEVAADRAREARVRLAAGVGDVTLSASPERSLLLAGDVRLVAGARLERRVSPHGRELRVELLEVGRAGPPPLGAHSDGAWSLALARDLPLALDVSAKVGDLKLDLADLRLKSLSLGGGVGDATVDLPGGGYAAKLHTNVGDLAFSVPRGAAVRVRVDTGVGDFRAPEGFSRDGDLYTSPGYAEARDRIDLTVSSGVGDIELKERE